MAQREYSGGCHCGEVRWKVIADLEESKALNCNCSICTKKGFLHLIVEAEQFDLLSGEDALQEYRFNTETAVHKFCSKCGVHSFYHPRSHPDGVDINLRCVDEISLDDLHIEDFDGRRWETNVDSIR